ISYLALTRETDPTDTTDPAWQDWYRYFPWEGHRPGLPALIASAIPPAPPRWPSAAPDTAAPQRREQRIAINFGLAGHDWNEDMVLQRYELLYEARLVPEALRRAGLPPAVHDPVPAGTPMQDDHRRILATGIARLRAKIKYRAV